MTSFLIFGLLAACTVLVARYLQRVIRQAIWRLRNRLIVTYAFIAVVPIALILALAGIGVYMVAGQTAVYLVSSELERRVAALENPARFLARAKPADRAGMVAQFDALIRTRLPDFEVLIGDETPPQGMRNYTGYALLDGRYYGLSSAETDGVTAVIRAPINGELLGKLTPGLGLITLTGANLEHPDVGGNIPPAWNNIVDFEVLWPGRLPIWKASGSGGYVNLVVRTRPSAVLNAVFGTQTDDAQTWQVLFAVIASLLLAVEIFALIVGVSLTRTVTGAVHGLYEGTTRIGKGDFSFRIPVTGKDQLAELGQAFNTMTAQLEGLLVVAKEKERLQSEIEIASEVQNQLFPRSAPVLETIELTGLCHPARMVSGDYFDYLLLPDGNLAIAIGDVAGKGISAALLMASIQSIVRTQLAAGTHIGPAGIVGQLNRQLHASTSSEKYATFFLGIYDERTRNLTYTNAGHLQPLLLRGSETLLLDVTGTIVGAFPLASYEERVVKIEQGDLFVAYTDGVTEPENAYGEEFGAARLGEVVMRHRNAAPEEIVARIAEAVRHWSTATELPDDMTVIFARGLES